MFIKLIVKMDFIWCLMIVIYFGFIEISCKSIHAHNDFYSDSESKTLNHRHDSKHQVSWIKLKPIIRQEMLLIRKDAESASLSDEITDEMVANKQQSSENPGLTKKEEINVNAPSQFSSNIITDLMKSNLTSMVGGNSEMVGKNDSNNTNDEPPKLDSSLNRKDFPYNITPDIMNQTGNLIIFLALNENAAESLNSNETSLMNEGTIITLEDISATELELLRDFEKQENLVPTKFSNIQRNLNEDNLTNFGKNFIKHPLEMNSSKDSIVPERTEETHTFTDFSEISTEKSDVLNTEQKIEVLFIDEDDGLQVDSNQNNITDLKNKEHNSGTNFSSTKSEIRELQEISSLPKSNTSKIAIVTADGTENDISYPVSTFKTDEATNVSSKRQNNPKCPDPGLCIFWFLAFDTCDEDSHCHGSLVCCMWGCSKMCLDPDAEIH